MSTSEKLLEMKNITKTFTGVHALSGVDFDLEEGEIHALCGENGAGKSTLMKILAGNYAPTEGKIYIYGKEVEMKNPLVAEKNGVAIVYQELCLSGTISVAENIFMGREPKNKLGLVNYKKMNRDAKKYLDMVHCSIRPDTITKLLTIAEMQLVQIAKALSLNAKILILDEPCSSISDVDSKRLFSILRDLKTKGIGMIYIDHRLENIFAISDRVTVFRDGERIGSKIISETSNDELIQMMVGRTITNIYPKESAPQSEIRLSVKNLHNDAIENFSVEIRKGEVLGLGGLVGAGRSEIIRALFGVDKTEKGKEIEVDGKAVKIESAQDAIDAGFGYIPEDRKLEGLCLRKDITFNAVLASLPKLVRHGFIDDKAALKEAEKMVGELDIKVNNMWDHVEQLSGGNQQKVVIAKWLMVQGLKVLLLDEPTRGVDVGAKFEIYKLIDSLAKQGVSIIVVTSELPELLGICDRIIVINRGRISGELDRTEFSQEAVMRACV